MRSRYNIMKSHLNKFGFIAVLLLVVCCQCTSTTTLKRPASPSFDSSSNKKSTTNRVMEPAFANAGQKAGLEIWRIEDFKPVAYPKDTYGKFFTGDSYIVLNTKINKAGQKSWDIHFWLGLETTQDESGTAAILSVQLDDQLGGGPIQHREVQEHESQQFLSYFKNGVRYAAGGHASGFHHVDRAAFEKRLFHVKGARNVRVKQTETSIAAMNTGDCFILDIGSAIYVYQGPGSKRMERMKSVAAANQIRDQDHAGKPRVTIVDEYSPESDFVEFFAALGGGARADVPEEGAGGDDTDFERSQERVVSLYRVSDATGSIKVDMVAQKPLQQSQLDSNDCFILDTTDSNLFVWVGKKCTQREKSESMQNAQNFLKTHKYPAWTNIQRVVEGAEPASFTQYFKSWKGASELHARLIRTASMDSQDSLEPRLFHAQIKGNSKKFIVEEIFDFTQDDLAEDDIMILDIVSKVYVWIGNGADDDERAGAHGLAKMHLKKLSREHVPISMVSQGEEPGNFTKNFPSWK